MVWRKFGCPVSPVLGMLTAVAVAAIGVVFSRGFFDTLYPVWNETIARWIAGLPFALILVSGVSAFTMSQLFHEDSVLNIGLGTRGNSAIVGSIIFTMSVISSGAFFLGFLPLTFHTLISGPDIPGVVVKVALPAVLSVMAQISAAVAVGAVCGLATRKRAAIFSALLPIGIYGVLVLLSSWFSNSFWAFFPNEELDKSGVSFVYSNAVRYLGLSLSAAVVLGISWLLIKGLSERPAEVPKKLQVAAPVTVATLLALSIVTGTQQSLFLSERTGNCEAVAGTETQLCLADFNEPRREELSLMIAALINRLGHPGPIREVADSSLPGTPDEGVLTVSIDRDGNNSEFLLIADVLAGRFACGNDTTRESFETTGSIAEWLKAAPLPEGVRVESVVAGDSQQNQGVVAGDDDNIYKHQYSQISGETPESVATMQQYLRDHEAAIASCTPPPLPPGVIL
ncbi:hypothetical protein CPHO_02935 [Corynebacterium phocae]|uniref:Uncharacterized protein n=1 Tax=Corynebacterium phocae TaxID=161895 RepID=A0A1L7D1W9_9CORY|nr:hypothetical protein [Corynebacterium phocae]APT92022.1 hypothetical protein CPHO_02935 [Corynebacterium phocae]KAA8726403.1 hypothetical protein F4V58_02480 [Corynebacterium phocae]